MAGSRSLQELERYGNRREGSGLSKRVWSALILTALIIAGVVAYEVWGGPTSPTPTPTAAPANR